MTAIAATLAAIVSRDLGDDLARAVTFPGGYLPTVRVMLQRHWSAAFDRLPALAATVRADTWIEVSIGRAHVGFRDNRDRDAYDRDARRLAKVLAAHGFEVRNTFEKGKIVATTVRTSKASDAAVEAAAPLYIERLRAALAAAA